MNLSSIMKSAPRYLALRYGALNSYVWESLYPAPEKNRILYRIKGESSRKKELNRMRRIVDEATLLVFVFVTRRIFLEGSDAAKKAVDTLKELGINEFYLGKAKFAGRNENVLQGERLAKKLFDSLSAEMKSLISESTYMSDVINVYREIR